MKRLSILFVVFQFAIICSAQIGMRVEKSDNSITQIPISEINRVSFEISSTHDEETQTEIRIENKDNSITRIPTNDIRKVFFDEVTDDEKRYGVKWSINDYNDLGQRCYDAVGKHASIGIGSIEGQSDFDSIYPWSDIKRCNIKEKDNGETVIIYEGNEGFALDGSSGDVFVRIPKFCVEKYIEDGYEYRVISKSGSKVHSAFIEDGNELDEIFISAFEGYIDTEKKLRSIAGVIPSNNHTPSEFLNSARANGINYSLYDMRCVDAVWTLMAVEYGCRNSNKIIGYGVSDYEQALFDSEKKRVRITEKSTNRISVNMSPTYQQAHMPVGSSIMIKSRSKSYTTILTQAIIRDVKYDNQTGSMTFYFDGDPVDVDAECCIGSAAVVTNLSESCGPNKRLNYHTGRCDFVSNSNVLNPIRYRWIENVVGNLWHFLPDVSFNECQMYVCRNMKDYEFHKIDDTYIPVGEILKENDDNGVKADVIGSNYWITRLCNDIYAKDYPFGKTYDKNLDSSKAFGAYYYLSKGRTCIANGGGFDHLNRCNMLTNRGWIEADTSWYLYGARLMYKNILK